MSSKLPIVINGEFDLQAAIRATCRFMEVKMPEQTVPVKVDDETVFAYYLEIGPNRTQAYICSDGEVLTKGWTLKDDLDGVTQMLFVSAFCLNALATYFLEHGIRDEDKRKYAFRLRGRDLDLGVEFQEHCGVRDVQAQVHAIRKVWQPRLTKLTQTHLN